MRIRSNCPAARTVCLRLDALSYCYLWQQQNVTDGASGVDMALI